MSALANMHTHLHLCSHCTIAHSAEVITVQVNGDTVLGRARARRMATERTSHLRIFGVVDVHAVKAGEKLPTKPSAPKTSCLASAVANLLYPHHYPQMLYPSWRYALWQSHGHGWSARRSGSNNLAPLTEALVQLEVHGRLPSQHTFATPSSDSLNEIAAALSCVQS